MHNLQPRFTNFVIALTMLRGAVVARSKSNHLKQTVTSLGIWEPTSVIEEAKEHGAHRVGLLSHLTLYPRIEFHDHRRHRGIVI